MNTEPSLALHGAAERFASRSHFAGTSQHRRRNSPYPNPSSNAGTIQKNQKKEKKETKKSGPESANQYSKADLLNIAHHQTRNSSSPSRISLFTLFPSVQLSLNRYGKERGEPGPCAVRRFRGPLRILVRGSLSLLLLCCWLGAQHARAAIQFDVFLGYDGIVPEASWFPIVCEVKNDGPIFNAIVELTGGGTFDQSLAIRLPVELPTGTLKRLVIPVFASMRGTGVWTVRLLDERGKIRAEQSNLPVRKQVPRNTPLLGSLARTSAGTPVIRKVRTQATDFQPMAARLMPSIFPDNPLVLEGLSSLYLNSERAAELSLNQVNAIFAWLNAGGHLIVAVEQPSDIASSPWLKSLFPCDVKELRTVNAHPELQDWLRQTTAQVLTGEEPDPNARAIPLPMRRRLGLNQPGSPSYPVSAEEAATATVTPFGDLRDDTAFEGAGLQVAVGRVREGKVEVQSGDAPLIVTAPRGRGRVTALMFSPEREPMRSWKNLETFWARLADVPGVWYTGGDVNLQGSWSSDGIFGAMIDSRQVHRLPVFWLLLLLAGYLVVIGPLDQYWLKRIGKPMLTWITFPCYVVLFSLVIYLIGYKLRAGESEWNEIHVVDVLPTEQGAELRGHTYSAVYSPSNQRYALASQQRYATFRNSFVAIWSVPGGSSERASVTEIGDGFKADVFVPVWSSELYVTDWWQPAEVPLTATIRQLDQGWEVKAENRTDHKVTDVKLVLADRIYDLGELAPGEAKTFTPSSEQGRMLRQFVGNQSAGFHDAVQSRQSALGSSERAQISDKPNSAIAACFLGELMYLRGAQEVFLSPPGLDLSAQLEHGNAFLLAWAPDYAPIKPMYQFHPRRSTRDTLWRVGLTMN